MDELGTFCVYNIRTLEMETRIQVHSSSLADFLLVDSVRFYNKYAPDEAFFIPQDQVFKHKTKPQESVLVPSQFSEVTIRVFTRAPEKQKAVQVAFRRRVDQLKKTVRLQTGESPVLPNNGEAIDFPSAGGSFGEAGGMNIYTTPRSVRTKDFEVTPGREDCGLSLTPRRAETLPDSFSSSSKKRQRMMMDTD